MKRINVMEEEFEVVEVLGQEALFTELRVDPATVPEGVHCYELRHGDNDSFPAAIEKKVTVNYFGAILLARELSLEDKEFLPLTLGDFGFTGETMTIQQFRQLKPEPQPFEEGRALGVYLTPTFRMAVKEADTLIGYLDTHDYAVGHRENKGFFLRDVNGEWKESSIDEVIDMVCDWNYDFIQITKVLLEEYSGETNETLKYFYGILLEEEKLLDGLFNHTKYGKKIHKLAEEIVKDVVQSSTQPRGLEDAVERVVEKIRKFRYEESE